MKVWSLGWLLACAGGPSPMDDAGFYRAALVDAPDLGAAQSACARIQGWSARGDCLVGVAARFASLDPGVCAVIDSALWVDECRFQLAERLASSGDVQGGLHTCGQTRFRRACAWHLLQDAVEASVVETPAEAELRIPEFLADPRLPDAATRFWQIRAETMNGRGHLVDETDCAHLATWTACEAGLHAFVRSTLETASGAHGVEEVCARTPGRRVLRKGQPLWAQGPTTRDAETRWERERCPAPVPPL